MSLLTWTDGQRPTHETAAQLQAAGKATCLRSALGDALGAAVEAGTAWADRTRRALAKRNSGLLLGKGLAAASSSLDRARAQLARLQVRPRVMHCSIEL